MQVISGGFGHQKIHYEAPPAGVLKQEMKRFFNWINQEDNLNLTLKALVAHLWFLTLHPFEDGNGRLARVISDLLLAKADGINKRFYSLSVYIERHQKEYYTILEETQKGSLEITRYLMWFLGCLFEAIKGSEQTHQLVFKKYRFLHNIPGYTPNPRQKKIVDLLFHDFKGHLTTSKYALLTKTSQDTATRDIAQLIGWGILIKVGKGRSTHYQLSVKLGS
jgi:Fic family protein